MSDCYRIDVEDHAAIYKELLRLYKLSAATLHDVATLLPRSTLKHDVTELRDGLADLTRRFKVSELHRPENAAGK